MERAKQEALEYIGQRSDLLFDMSDRIWEHPEVGFTEHYAARLFSETLEKEGFTVEQGVGDIPTSVVGTFGSGGPVIGFLGEFDALPGLSQEAGLAEKKPLVKEGPGHGCGHNLLGAGAAGAALLLRDYLQQTGQSGTVVFLGCPAEEGGSGKAYMARAGLFDDLDAALTWHPGGGNAVMTGSMMANCQAYFRFTGKASHAAAAPHLGRSALDAVELMDVGVNYMREHIEPTDRIHYAVLDTGGTSPNVVQSHAEVLYLIRSTDAAKVRALYDRVCKIARGAAMMTETEVQIVFDKGCSETLSNPVLESVLYDSMKKIPLPAYTPEELAYAAAIHETCLAFDPASDLSLGFLPNRQKRHYAEIYRTKAMADLVVEHQHLDVFVPGSSDVGDASKVVPTAQFIAATATPGTPAHSWQMTAQGKSGTAAKGMWYAAQVLADAAITLVQNPALIQKAQQEFREATEGKPYECPIPANIPPHRNVEELLALQK